MRAIIQRVKKASVIIDELTYASINTGLLVLIAFEKADTQVDIDWIIHKIIHCRIFYDKQKQVSLIDSQSEILLVSQFTLYASVQKGNRPSYIQAAPSDIAQPLYNLFIKEIEAKLCRPIQTGVFGAHMDISSINQGPLTLLIDSKTKT